MVSYGKKQPEYKLDYIAEQELGLRKIEYIEKGMTLDEFFIENPIESTLYNIVDVVLILGLSNKLQFFDLHNQIRRAMYTPLQASIIGSSALYDSFIFSQLDKDNKKIRCNMVTENSVSFPLEYTSQFGEIRGARKKPLPPIKITAKDFQSTTKKYPGAYVKLPYPEIIADQTMIIDLDASLPPWEVIHIKRNDETKTVQIGDYNYLPGDLALTWDDNNNICYKPILGKVEHDWNSWLITFQVEIQNKLYECQVTDNHSIFGIKSNQLFPILDDSQEISNLDYISIKLIDANILEIGDWIVINSGNDKIVLGKIKNKIQDFYTGKVYDISVDETERFFAGTGIGAHNTSMYPSNIKQGNISFDTYVARIVPPQCYPTINLLKKYLGSNTQYPPAVFSNVQKYVTDYADTKSVKNKEETIQKFYYIIRSLFKVLLDSGQRFEDIAVPQTDQNVLLLKNILIPLLDALFTIHPLSEIYNTFIYDYVYDGMINYDNIFENKEALKRKYNDQVWVILNPNECNTQLIPMDIDQIYNFIQQYSVTFSGCMFLKHDVKKGLFIDMLTDFAALRKSHKKLRDTYEKGSQSYKFEDNNQNVFKRLMNTCYGLYGLASFRYSDHWLARSITNNSLHALKCAIYKGEEYLTNLLKGVN